MKAKSGGILPAERNVHKMKLGMSCYCLDGAMAKGMTVDEVAAALEGNTCGRRATSCADQLVRGLREARAKELADEAGVEAGAPHEAV